MPKDFSDFMQWLMGQQPAPMQHKPLVRSLKGGQPSGVVPPLVPPVAPQPRQQTQNTYAPKNFIASLIQKAQKPPSVPQVRTPPARAQKKTKEVTPVARPMKVR